MALMWLLAIKLANMVSADVTLSTSVPAATYRAIPPPIRDRAETFVLWQSCSMCRLTSFFTLSAMPKCTSHAMQ